MSVTETDRPAGAEAPQATETTEAQRVVEWRAFRLEKLGIDDPALRDEIADSFVDVHDLERLLNAGCKLDVAWRILAPLPGALTWSSL